VADERRVDDIVDVASMDSFPASDPPAYSSRSVGGPSADGPRAPARVRPQSRAHSGRDVARTVAATQAAYYVVTAMAPFVSRRGFERVTGRKHDWWLVQSVGATVGAVGLALGVAATRRPIEPQTRTLGVACAAGLAAVDAGHALRGRISRVYLLDAVLEVAFVAGWIASARRQPKRLAD
jgi:hypothetical protein